MAVNMTVYVSTLMHYAYELGQARLSGDEERIAEAQRKHDAYRDICLMADNMVLDIEQTKLGNNGLL